MVAVVGFKGERSEDLSKINKKEDFRVREIKFRAWAGKQMHLLEPKVGATLGMLSDLASEPQWEVMQFTGAYDSTGQPIYDKDILRGPANRPYVVAWDALPCHMCWAAVPVEKYDQFIRHQQTGEGSHPVETDAIHDRYGHPHLVIGNIYENPEIMARKDLGGTA
jgi:hypothetical protein